jgi:predicted dehydrogenase
MSRPIEAVLIGAGQRGAQVYGAYALRYPEQLKFVAVAEPDEERRRKFAADHRLPPENVFQSWQPLFAMPQLGQAALVCTQDQQHTGPALAGMKAGYDVLLEKPIATTAEDCRSLVQAAHEFQRQLRVCHVLRYTPHFLTLRQVVKSGQLGQIITVDHRENLSWWHMAHSYVRGNWANLADSSPMILAKCCHDFDILLWVLEGECLQLSSLGSLLHFRSENAPEGAPPYCLDGCPIAAECPYYAPFIYIELLPYWRSFIASSSGYARLAVKTNLAAPRFMNLISKVMTDFRQYTDYREWPRSVVSGDPTPENLEEALRRGPYGRCVYRCDNDVVDNQVVMMKFTGGYPVVLTVQGHSHLEGRTTSIEGSRGSVKAFFGVGGAWVEVFEHRTGKKVRYNTSAWRLGGHGGGDSGLLSDFVKSLQGEKVESLSSANQTLESHLMAFAAEDARLENRIISREEFI